MRSDASYQSMVELLAGQAAAHPDRIAYAFLDDRDGINEITFAQLERRARVIAARLQLELKPGDRALLVFPAGIEFISAFFGCLYAGVVAVPATYPKPKRPMPRLQRIALDCGAHVALSTAQTLTTLDPELLSTDAATSSWIATDELDDALAEMWQPTLIATSDLAFLQYTSGSTSDPKGVMVSHSNLLNNLECISRSFGIAELSADQELATGVFWLPAYHDMGLIGGILTPLYMGGRSVLMSPTAFLQKPMRWLQAIHDYQAIISGAPNFAYEYCVRRTRVEEREKLNLSCWRLAFCGAEPIRAETLTHFSEAFAPTGFQLKAFYPCYGLAECTLLASGPDYQQEPQILEVNRAALAEHRVALACGEPAAMVQRLVGCGPSTPDHRIVIVDPVTLQECPDEAVGEILIQGPSVTQGYWNRPIETDEFFRAVIEGQSGKFLRTGDLGFFRDGQLFVTGRVKDVIIIRGRNHYPQDIEQSAEEAHPAVLAGAAFALEDAGGERLVVVHQLDRQYRGSDYHQIEQAIRRAIVEQHELDPYAIVLIRQTSLPITSSGKVQRNLCREQYLADELRVVHCWTNPAIAREPGRSSWSGRRSVQVHGEGVAMSAATEQPATAAADDDYGKSNGMLYGVRPPRPGAPVMELDRAAERIEAWMLEWLVGRLALDAADVSRDRPFAEFGVDSLTAVELSHDLEQQFGVPLPPIVAWNYPTPAALSRYLAEQTTGIKDPNSTAATEELANLQTPPAPNDDQLAALLAEVEKLSEDEAQQLLADEERRA